MFVLHIPSPLTSLNIRLMILFSKESRRYSVFFFESFQVSHPYLRTSVLVLASQSMPLWFYLICITIHRSEIALIGLNYVALYILLPVWINTANRYAGTYIYIYIYIYVCVYIYIYIYIHTHTHTHKHTHILIHIYIIHTLYVRVCKT